jgi:hypothetical protein
VRFVLVLVGSRKGEPARFLFRIPGKLDVATIDPSPT